MANTTNPAPAATERGAGHITGASDAQDNSPIARDRQALARLELLHGRLRVELAAVELDAATSMLSAGTLSADGALMILDEAFERLEGLSP